MKLKSSICENNLMNSCVLCLVDRLFCEKAARGGENLKFKVLYEMKWDTCYHEIILF